MVRKTADLGRKKGKLVRGSQVAGRQFFLFLLEKEKEKRETRVELAVVLGFC